MTICIKCGHGEHASPTVGRSCTVSTSDGEVMHACPCPDDFPTVHPDRCTARDHTKAHVTGWRCHKHAGHPGACSTHNDCGQRDENQWVCGKEPGHEGPCWKVFDATDRNE